MTTIDLSMQDMMSSIRLRVRFERTCKARLWLAASFMKLAALIAGCGIDIDTDSEPASKMAENGRFLTFSTDPDAPRGGGGSKITG